MKAKQGRPQVWETSLINCSGLVMYSWISQFHLFRGNANQKQRLYYEKIENSLEVTPLFKPLAQQFRDGSWNRVCTQGYCAFSFNNLKVHIVRDGLHTYAKAEGGDYISQLSHCLEIFLKSGEKKMMYEKHVHEPATTHVNHYNMV